MSDAKTPPFRGPQPPQAKYQRKEKPKDDDYSTKQTLVDYEWTPPAAAKEEAAAVILEEDDDLPEVELEMEPLDEP